MLSRRGTRVLDSIFKTLGVNSTAKVDPKGAAAPNHQRNETSPLDVSFLSMDVDLAMTILGENKDLAAKYSIVNFKAEKVH